MPQLEKKATILIVDDIPSNLELLTSYLGDYNTAIAKNGVKAIQRAEMLLPDLILMDIQMPEMDGYEACRQLKNNEKTKHIPVIFMTALSDSRSKVEGFELGAVDYITKPIDSAELLARVHTHLALHQTRQELKERNEELERNALRQKRVQQIMRHDLKSPLQAIVSLPDLMMNDANLTEDQRELIELVDEAAHQMLNMINSSLLLYKIESGVYTPYFENVELLKVIEKAAAPFSFHPISIKANTCEINSSATCTIQAEELLIYTLFSNLIKNAYEASPRDKAIVITVQCEDMAIVKITNSGTVPTEIRENFFEEFATSGKEHGTGLGTYSARLIAEALGGSIALDSSQEGQTTIAVSFPHNRG